MSRWAQWIFSDLRRRSDMVFETMAFECYEE